MDSSANAFGGDGDREAAGQVEGLRAAYGRYAETTERTLNAVEATQAQARQDLRAVAGGAREAAQHLSETGLIAARQTRDRALDGFERGYTLFERQAARNRGGLRTLTQHLMIAFDRNVRAGLDCAERLAGAHDLAAFTAIHLEYLREQSRRTAEQITDLQRIAAEVARSAVALPD